MKQKPQSLVYYVREECNLIFEDKWLFSLVSWLPIVLFFLLWSIISDGVCRDLPVGIIDYDQTTLSRELSRSYELTPVISLESYIDERSAFSDLRSGKIYGLIIIPQKLAEDTAKRLQPTITAHVNYEYLLVGKQINSALQAAHTTTTVRLDVGRNLVSNQPVFQAALAGASPIAVQFNTLANKNSDYGQFLVTAMIPAVWQILVVMSAVMSFAATNRSVGVKQWLQFQRQKRIIAKLLPLSLIFLLQGMLFLWLMFGLIGWPMHGSWFILGGALIITVAACLGAGSFFYLLTCDATRALSISAAYTAPGFAFMGVTFPVSDMNVFAKVWRSLLPVSHYSEIQIAVANYGATFLEIHKPVLALLLFLIVYVLVFVLASVRASTKHDKQVKA